jgi:hypothetical protein
VGREGGDDAEMINGSTAAFSLAHQGDKWSVWQTRDGVVIAEGLNKYQALVLYRFLSGGSMEYAASIEAMVMAA